MEPLPRKFEVLIIYTVKIIIFILIITILNSHWPCINFIATILRIEFCWFSIWPDVSSSNVFIMISRMLIRKLTVLLIYRHIVYTNLHATRMP